MRVKCEDACLRCGGSISEPQNPTERRDAFIVTGCHSDDWRNADIQQTSTRAAQLSICDECFSREFMQLKRGSTVWPTKCCDCGEPLDDTGIGVRISLGIVADVPVRETVMVDEVVPPHCVSPDVFICMECAVEFFGARDAYFIVDMELPELYEEEDEEDISSQPSAPA